MKGHWKVVVVIIFTVIVGGSAYYFMCQRVFDTTLQAIKQEDAARARERLVAWHGDSRGSSTPEGTLELYKQAILQENYKLATEFFILEKIDAEFIKILSADRYTRDEYLRVLEKLEPGSYSEDGMLYTMRASLPGPDFFARFRKYPNNLWKIIEI